jgi:hypothetical protein
MPQTIQMFVGVAPVTESSGKQHWVHWRLQCPTFLRQTLRRVGRPDHHPFLLGRRLLSATTRQRLRASDRCSGLGLQVDTHSLPLLAVAHAV